MARPVGGSDEAAEGIPFIDDMGDLTLGVFVAVFATLLAGLHGPLPLRTVFGLPLVLFIPGYALVSALFPGADGLDGLERIALGVGLSLAVIPLIALGIEYSPWRLTLNPILLGLLCTTLVFTAVAGVRRRRLDRSARFVAQIPRPSVPPPSTWDRGTRVAVVILLAAVTLFSISGGVLVYERLQGEPMTEFALYNAAGKPEFYPRDFAPGEQATIHLGVTNRELRDATYSIRVTVDDQLVASVARFTLKSGQSWQEPLKVSLPNGIAVDANGQVPMLFQLYRLDGHDPTQPYRTLRLFVRPAAPRS